MNIVQRIRGVIKNVLNPVWLLDNKMDTETRNILSVRVKDNSHWLDVGCGFKPFVSSFTQQSVNWATRTRYFIDRDSRRRVGTAHAVDMAVERQILRGLRPPYETVRTCSRMSNPGYKK